MSKVDFTVMGLDGSTDEFLNWCIQHRDSLEYVKSDGMFEHFEREGKDGKAELHFNPNAILMSINKSILSHRP